MTVYTLIAEDGFARAGLLKTHRAEIPTPVFMPVGTQATVKSLTPVEVEATGARIVLANTYHLWLRPGAERIHRLGGLCKFMAWPHAVLTDSGGFQVYSLAKLRTIDDDGVRFRSHIDGALCHLTPEKSMEIQRLLGSDIAMALDECPPADAPREVIQSAMNRTTSWAKRCLEAPLAAGQSRFCIVQGGTHVDLRLAHLEALSELSYDGMALGGLSVGEPTADMISVLQAVAHQMPSDRPRYLMGVGTPFDLLHGIAYGIDMFDCVLPTRNARNGQALTWNGRVNLKQARHRDDLEPIDPACQCPVCATYSRAYLRHLVTAGEMTGCRLVTQHNLFFYGDLMQKARKAIQDSRYLPFAREAIGKMIEGDEVETAPGARQGKGQCWL